MSNQHQFMKPGDLLSDDYGQFLRSFDWRWYCTYTFGHSLSDEKAKWLFERYIDEASAAFRSSVSYAGCLEKSDSGAGKPAIRAHLHVLMNCALGNATFLRDLWSSERYGGTMVSGSAARIVEYAPSGGAAQYIVKHLEHSDQGLLYGNLELCAQRRPASYQNSSKVRRMIRRNEERLQKQRSMPSACATTVVAQAEYSVAESTCFPQ